MAANHPGDCSSQPLVYLLSQLYPPGTFSCDFSSLADVETHERLLLKSVSALSLVLITESSVAFQRLFRVMILASEQTGDDLRSEDRDYDDQDDQQVADLSDSTLRLSHNAYIACATGCKLALAFSTLARASLFALMTSGSLSLYSCAIVTLLIR